MGIASTALSSGEWHRSVQGGVELDVLVVPRASRTRVVGLHENRLKIQLAAAPADGEANAALVELLSEALAVKRSQVTLLAGHGSRRKRVRVAGLTGADVVAAFGLE